MPVETPSLFASVIKDHLELKARNAELDGTMPITHYTSEDPFENHPLFKSEEQARIEETMDGTEPAIEFHSNGLATAELPDQSLPWPGEDATEEHGGAALEGGLWSRTRDFDWGD